MLTVDSVPLFGQLPFVSHHAPQPKSDLQSLSKPVLQLPPQSSNTPASRSHPAPEPFILKKIATVMNAPHIRQRDSQAFQKFVLVCALVWILQTLGHVGAVVLQCDSHVEWLLSKLYKNEAKDLLCELQNAHPDRLFIVARDFNHANLKTMLPKFNQYVDFAV